jgi:hypothetical protein
MLIERYQRPFLLRSCRFWCIARARNSFGIEIFIRTPWSLRFDRIIEERRLHTHCHAVQELMVDQQKFSNATRNVVLPTINRGAPDGCRERFELVNKRDAAHCHSNHLIRIRDKEIRKVEVTFREQENEWNCETVDLHTMRNGYKPEKSSTTSDDCH